MNKFRGPVTDRRTPQQYVASHLITKQLTKRGVTDEQLAQLRFREKDRGYPFDEWSFTWGGNLPPEAIPFVKAYCALKWLILEEPPASRDKEDAWRYVNDAMIAPAATIGLKHREAQRQRAQRPRVKVTDDGQTIRQIVEQLARNPEYKEETAPELWRRFYAALDELGLDPKEVMYSERTPGYEYTFRGIRRKMSYRQFANNVSVSRVRKSG